MVEKREREALYEDEHLRVEHLGYEYALSVGETQYTIPFISISTDSLRELVEGVNLRDLENKLNEIDPRIIEDVRGLNLPIVYIGYALSQARIRCIELSKEEMREGYKEDIKRLLAEDKAKKAREWERSRRENRFGLNFHH